jgi:hypothetical protein
MGLRLPELYVHCPSYLDDIEMAHGNISQFTVGCKQFENKG